jgi:hypothetical protein
VVKAELSAIVVTRCSYRQVELLMRLLANQTIASRMEVVFCHPKGESGDLPQSITSCFSSVVWLETPRDISPAQSRALAVEKVSAPLVVFTEEHCFPDRSWAEHLVAAHSRADWAAVSPAFHNANPKFAESWALFLLEYGDFAFPHPGGELPCLPGNNSCYRTARLREVGSALGFYLSNETLLHWTMKNHGWRYCLEPNAHVFHTNVTILSAMYLTSFNAGRRFAYTRASTWSRFGRIFYFLGAPLIPLLRLLRGRAHWRRAYGAPLRGGTTIHLIGGLIVSGFGEMLGSVGLIGDGNKYLTMIELDRQRFLRNGDTIELSRIDHGMQDAPCVNTRGLGR